MKISYRWLSDYIEHSKTPHEVADFLTHTGLEVEDVQDYASLPHSLEGVVVGEVTDVKPHPDADKLTITKVNAGTGELLQIICGAPNVKAGQKVAVALVGTTLLPASDKPLKIRKAKIRGVESAGMICAEDELGLGNDHSGIMVLNEDLTAGMPLKEALELYEDTVLEIGLTPNRGDAASHIGVARDLAAYLRKKIKYPDAGHFKIEEESFNIKIKIENRQDCPRYAGVVLSNVKVGESPKWLQNRLKAIGMQPVNNVVDATNFVMLEMGQPLHAFDIRQIAGNEIVVKRAEKGAKFITLDGKTRELTGHELMIWNAEIPVGIAGVMGGENSEIKDDTTTIFIESAFFDPTVIRNAARHHKLHTDAAFRFERVVDIENTIYALMRSALLIGEIAGAKVSSRIFDEYPYRIERPEIRFSFQYLNKLTGSEVPSQEVVEILEHLEYQILHRDKEGLQVAVPLYRGDVTRPADLAEEVLRIYSLNRISFSNNVKSVLAYTHGDNKEDWNESTARYLSSNGFFEILSTSLSNSEYLKYLPENEQVAPVEILEPLSEELDIMRTTMLFSGLEALRYNINRQQRDLKLYEFGRTYRKEGFEYIEEQHLAIWITGNLRSLAWNDQEKEADYYFAKGILQMILKQSGMSSFEFDRLKAGSLAYGQFLELEKKSFAKVGKVKPEIVAAFDIGQDVFYADIDLDLLYQHQRGQKVHYKPVSKFPVISRDLSLLLPSSAVYEAVKQEIVKAAPNMISEVTAFDVYTGNKVEQGKKSYAVRIIFRDEEKTLKDAQIDRVVERMIENLEKNLNAKIRK